jgi:protein tyrosine phosphatase
LRDKLLVVDQQDGDVELALRELREHIYSHMNSELGGSNVQQPIQLKYRYERLVNAEKVRVTQAMLRLPKMPRKYVNVVLVPVSWPAAVSSVSSSIWWLIVSKNSQLTIVYISLTLLPRAGQLISLVLVWFYQLSSYFLRLQDLS